MDILFYSPTCSDKIEYRKFDWAPDPVTSYNIDLQYEKFPCPPEVYDFVFCLEVIEHMPVDPMFHLSELNRIMKMGGQLMLSTPNIASMSSISKILQGDNPIGYSKFKKSKSSDRHNIEYNYQQVCTLLKSSGFTIKKSCALNSWSTTDNTDLYDLLSSNPSFNFDINNRGENLIFIAEKSSGIVDRYPDTLYD